MIRGCPRRGSANFPFWVEERPPVLEHHQRRRLGRVVSSRYVTKTSRVPEYTLLSFQSNWNVSPAGTPACVVESDHGRGERLTRHTEAAQKGTSTVVPGHARSARRGLSGRFAVKGGGARPDRPIPPAVGHVDHVTARADAVDEAESAAGVDSASQAAGSRS